MIEALDESIKQLLIQKTPLNTAEVDISFDVPNREWSGSISKPTINIYLYDLRENVELRQIDWYDDHLEDGTVNRIQLGGRYDLSYLITAWTTNVEDEHRLLWYVLSTLVRFPILPQDILQEPLYDQSYNIPTKVAQSDGVLRNAADVWTALDNQLKPVLTFVTTIALDSRIIRTTKETKGRFLRFSPPDGDALSTLNTAPLDVQTATEYVQIAGRIKDANGEPVRAEVVLVEQGLTVQSDSQGRYFFRNIIQRPKINLLIVAAGFVTGRHEVAVPATSYDFTLQREAELVSS